MCLPFPAADHPAVGRNLDYVYLERNMDHVNVYFHGHAYGHLSWAHIYTIGHPLMHAMTACNTTYLPPESAAVARSTHVYATHPTRSCTSARCAIVYFVSLPFPAANHPAAGRNMDYVYKERSIDYVHVHCHGGTHMGTAHGPPIHPIGPPSLFW